MIGNKQFNIHEDSLEIGENVPVKFLKCAYKHGKSYKTGDPWYALDFIFYDDVSEKFLVHKAFQPPKDKYFLQREYSILLSEILNSLADKDLWSKIKASRDSWESFYTNYLTLVDEFRKKKVYIKTIACPHWKDKDKFIACLAEKNFISTRPDLKYTYLERNEVEDFLSEDLNTIVDNKEILLNGINSSNNSSIFHDGDIQGTETKESRGKSRETIDF